MTKQKKLTKLIEIAVENGYGVSYYEKKEDVIDFLVNDYERPSENDLLFDHDFAKAIWGEEGTCPNCGCHKVILNKTTPDMTYGEYEIFQECSDCHHVGSEEYFNFETNWQYHLQQAVISKDPLEYYWENK